MPTKGTLHQITEYAVSAAYLRPSQIYNRIRFVLRKKFFHKSPSFQSWYLRQSRGDESVHLLSFPSRYHGSRFDIASIADGKFTFLNQEVDLGNPIEWTASSQTKLWQYNLHYFDYAVELAFAFAKNEDQHAYKTFRQLVQDWIDHCPVAMPISWDAYPTSLRVVNWIKAYGLLHSPLECDRDFAKSLRRSIYIQTAFMEQHLEYHLLNNHLLENGKTLFIAGHFFSGPTATRWREKGKHILTLGLRSNFLADGGHEERSPMYHQIMLDLYDDVQAVVEQTMESGLPNLPEQIQSMREWLHQVLHPDGEIPLLNDAAFGIAPSPADSLRDVGPLQDGLTTLVDSGYFTFRDRSKRQFLIFDAGPLGPDHQTAHGHCDTLSYELSIAGKRIIVDSGVGSYYGNIQWRNYYRSTRAHNTVVVDGEEQSEIWDRFRVARRAHPKDLIWSTQANPNLDYVSASHDGYRRLKGQIMHRRTICWVHQRFWVVCDQLIGRGQHSIESLIHLHPDVRIISNLESAKTVEVRRDDATMCVTPWGFEDRSLHCGETEPIQGWYAPEFGLHLKNQVLAFHQNDVLPMWNGYVLWPESRPATCEFETINPATGQLHVSSLQENYEIIFEQHDVRLEYTG